MTRPTPWPPKSVFTVRPAPCATSPIAAEMSPILLPTTAAAMPASRAARRHIHQLLIDGVDGADDDREGRVGDPAVDRRGEVEREEVAILKLVVEGEAVQHGVVDRGADDLAERRAAEGRVVVDVAALGALGADHVVRQRIELEQVDADVGGVARRLEHASDEGAGGAHLLDLGGGAQFDHRKSLVLASRAGPVPVAE